MDHTQSSNRFTGVGAKDGEDVVGVAVGIVVGESVVGDCVRAIGEDVSGGGSRLSTI